jgi:hypothetical protein
MEYLSTGIPFMWRLERGRSLRASEKAAGEMGSVVEDMLRLSCGFEANLCLSEAPDSYRKQNKSVGGSREAVTK